MPESPPKSQSSVVTTRVTPECLDELDRIAQAEDRTRSYVVSMLISDGLKRRAPKPKPPAKKKVIK